MSHRLLPLSVLFLSSSLLLPVGCEGDDEAFDDQALQDIAHAAGISGDPTSGRTLASMDDPRAYLGKLLFFTKGLGGNNDSACVTCHHPMLGGGDNLSLPIGVGAEVPDLLGPGRQHDAQAHGGMFDGGATVPRNAPTTFNIALWDQVIFHDGRIESLGRTPGANGDDGLGIVTPDEAPDPFAAAETLAAAQARFPVTSPEEMRGFEYEHLSNDELREELSMKLSEDWKPYFDRVYGVDTIITYTLIADAIGEYERSQLFVDNPWNAYMAGDMDAISESAKHGATLFFTGLENGGANCASCHTGDVFTDEQFHVLAAPQIGRGKGVGVFGDDDFGRSEVSGDVRDLYQFRTPTLLNVEVTGPWTHAGAYTTLDGVVRHMLNPGVAIAEYDRSLLESGTQVEHLDANTELALSQLQANRASNVSDVHRDVVFTDQDVTDLVSFLEALTDPCVKDRDCMAPWISTISDADPDGLRLNAIDQTGAPL
jgi:cytochrome c peroxidase